MASDEKKGNIALSSSKNEFEDFIWTVELATEIVQSIIDEQALACGQLDSNNSHTHFQNSSLSFNNEAISDSSLPIEKNSDDNDDIEISDVIPIDFKNIPDFGPLERKKLEVGRKVWVMERNISSPIVEGMIIASIPDEDGIIICKVRFQKEGRKYDKLHTSKELAYKENSDVIVPMGTRIVALYKERMSAGVVAEHPIYTNSFRYLIFFDDNHAEYIEQKNIHVMCDQTKVFQNLSAFIQTYLKNYPERPMAKFKKNQLTRTKYDGKWERTIVLDIDGSLVKMHFIDKDIIEWIYRGCERFELISDLVDRETEKARKYRRRVPRTYNHPYVEFTRDSETAVVYDSDKKRKGEFPNDGSSEDYAKNGLIKKRMTNKEKES